MSRNFVPVALSIGAGVLGGYYVWQPYFKEMQQHQHQHQHQQQQSLNSTSTGSTAPQSQVPTPQEAGSASTTGDMGVGKAAGQ
ncbi:hypothetical protein BO86DRAFT_402892 [Aspergillus japonicus CBS 114.51]|uniref:Uncharacterized protein n=2 Tax=Aspergillus TaxID=5052 RepID=A0A2V5HPZ7_ASPV1|nr:hypothetical protein BO86DRAFT_402892 [Aspergillus japonicus CBS 114.51]PYI24712.1 hypothetical protein BO99DRAFT_398190 [Aspergillus violaceofuscus CBS 115571]RAH78346.1 hypothetical protein BO86DRAFT_402892 [Aspergillus japonicus CBS 114.51]